MDRSRADVGGAVGLILRPTTRIVVSLAFLPLTLLNWRAQLSLGADSAQQDVGVQALQTGMGLLQLLSPPGIWLLPLLLSVAFTVLANRSQKKVFLASFLDLFSAAFSGALAFIVDFSISFTIFIKIKVLWPGYAALLLVASATSLSLVAAVARLLHRSG